MLLALAGCSGGPAGALPPLTIGAISPLSGPQAPGGKEELAGFEAARTLAQRSGIQAGGRLKLQVEDATTPEAASAAVDRLRDRYTVPLIVGTYGSALSAAASARAEVRKTVYWETGAVADQITLGRRYVFRTVATGANLGTEAVDFTARVLLPRAQLQPAAARAVIVSVDDIYGRSVGDGQAARARELGINVVDRVNYAAASYDAGAIADRVAADRADYLWDVSYIDDGIAIWQQVLQRHVQLRAAVGTSSAFCTPDFGRRMGADAVGVFAADKPDAEIKSSALNPEGRALLEQAKAIYAGQNAGRSMGIPAVAGFVGGWALFHDVLPRVSGPITADAIRKAALQVHVPARSTINGGGVQFGPEGSLDQGQNQLAAAVVGQWQGVNRMRVVYPDGYAQAAILPAA